MNNNHGNPPLDPEATWTKVIAYAAKNKEPKDKSNKEKEKNDQNKAQEGKNKAIGTRTNVPWFIDSNYVTRINFKVIPHQTTTTLSELNSIIRIMAAAKAANPTAHIIATDKDGKKKEFHRAKSSHQTMRKPKNSSISFCQRAKDDNTK